MNWVDLGKKLASEGLPMLGSAVGGRAGEKVGEVIASALGVSNDPGEIEMAISADPEAYVKLRAVEAGMNARELQHTETLAAIHTKDVQDARRSVSDDSTRRWLAVFLVPAPLMVGAYILWANPEGGLLAVVTSILGYLIGEAKGVTGFYFGTSVGSKDKQNVIEKELRR